MMHFYGYKQIDPCKYCGTPRVGADYDNDYYVSPGTLEQTCKQGQCLCVHLTLCNPDNGKRWVYGHASGRKEEDGIVAIGADLAKFDFYIPEQYAKKDIIEQLGAWSRCPECGTELNFKLENGSVTYFIGHCPAKGIQDKIKKLPGCEKCSGEFHGGHFVD